MTVDAVLEGVLAGRELSVEGAEMLFAAEGEALSRLLAVADDIRKRRVGERVAYVVTGTLTSRTCASSDAAFVLSAGATERSRVIFYRSMRFCAASAKPGILALPRCAFRRAWRLGHPARSISISAPPLKEVP